MKNNSYNLKWSGDPVLYANQRDYTPQHAKLTVLGGIPDLQEKHLKASYTKTWEDSLRFRIFLTDDFFLDHKLKKLTLAGFTIRNPDFINRLSEFSQLKQLSFKDLRFTNSNTDQVSLGLAQLEELEIEDTPVKIEDLTGCPSLKTLILKRTQTKTLPNLPAQLAALTFVSKLNFTLKEAQDIDKQTQSIPQRDLKFQLNIKS